MSIPDETYQSYPHLDEQLTMRKLLQAAGVEPSCVSMWHLYGVPYDGMNGTTPFLDAAIPGPVTGVDPNIVVSINVPHVDTMQHVTADAEEGSLSEVFERIDADWNASLEIEKELTRLRKKLLDMSARLNTLNRDLSSQERLHSNSQDKKDWLDVRRRLRDTDTRLRMCIKEHNIGDASPSGRRNWFEQTYQQFIVPRQQFDGMQQAQRDYESHRKLVQTLQINMNTAYSTAAQDGERRAQQVLNRIAAKIREATTKKNFLDAIRD
ncbi:MAG: hypothetical protein IH899_18765 [Planctomycetes bacterium]|nr:hypothetical protein [Planctomycetota bacterium]